MSAAPEPARDQLPGYRCRLAYRAAPAEVYAAAARPGGENGWWTTEGEVAIRQGDLMRLNWSPRDFIVFRLDLMRSPKAMEWTCVEQHDANLPQVDEWVGTTLRFRFSPSAEGTVLDFEHAGLVPSLDCYDVCENGWDFFLRRSLTELVEDGKGAPYRYRATATA